MERTVGVMKEVKQEPAQKHSELQKIVSVLDSMLQDTSIPRNVRANLSLAKQRLESNSDLATAVGGAIYALDEISNDINLPTHGRTMVWNLLSELEALKQAEN